MVNSAVHNKFVTAADMERKRRADFQEFWEDRRIRLENGEKC